MGEIVTESSFGAACARPYEALEEKTSEKRKDKAGFGTRNVDGKGGGTMDSN